MMINLDEISNLVTIIGGALAGLMVVTIRPLRNMIKELNETINKVSESFDQTRDKLHDVDKRVVAVENSTKSAHHRIDDLKEKMDK